MFRCSLRSRLLTRSSSIVLPMPRTKEVSKRRLVDVRALLSSSAVHSSKAAAVNMHSVLVYNVTHSDLILGVAPPTSSPPIITSDDVKKDEAERSKSRISSVVFARPKFSFVEPIARGVLNAFRERKPPAEEGTTPLDAPDLIFTAVAAGDGNREDGLSTRLCVGFSFENEPLYVPWSSLHLRGSADPPEGEKQARVVSAFIPLAAQAIPEWAKRSSSCEKCSKFVLLVCGTGRPQDSTASFWGNSTLATAELIAMFLQKLVFADEPTTTVQVMDSSAFDVFDYDQNVRFVREKLMPTIDSIRRVAALNGKDWRKQMEVTVSLTEGSPARLGALSAALRTYRPWYAHLCQLKTFWHEKRILASDLRFYSFERVETTPPLVVSELSSDMYKEAVAELIRYRDEFQRTMLEMSTNELQSFWLRKSSRPVLSVLVVAAPHNHSIAPFASPARREHPSVKSNYIFYRGINLEVSQPTGSLCSERNAIGSALAANPGLNRRDVKLVAVLSLPKLTPPLAAMSGLPTASASSGNATPEPSGASSANGGGAPVSKRLRSESIQSGFQLGEGADVNPLGPCGACTEWLRKIAEVNPDFKVMTFRDVSCRECFLKEVE